MGPNEGKTYLEQTKCVARVLTSVSPKARAHDPITDEKMLTDYETEHGSLYKKWIKRIYSFGEQYVYLGDPLEGGGRSSDKLPEGEEIAATFDLRSTENGLLKRFRTAITQLEQTIDHVSLLEDLANLKKTLEVCQSGYNEKEIAKFRKWLKESPDTFPYPTNPSLLGVNPERLTAFSKHLAGERTKYCADALLFGSVAATVDICNYCASKVHETTRADLRNRKPIDIVVGLSLVLTSDDSEDPAQILAGTVQKAINWGFVRQLFDICSKYRDKVEDLKEQALNSETTDESFDKLYEAIPYALATKIILVNLLNNPDKLGNSFKKARGSFEIIEESLVRLRYAITNQITDFFGADWKRYKALVARSRAESGETTANKYVEWIIEENLFYPRRFKSALLSKDF